MASEILEKVKIEIRSILLSSKHGVAAESIKSDYEMLMCQKLPLKELGFKDVQSLMRAIPDVAEEVRSYTGEITYHAVCDESTAHIQKLVSHQTTKKKKNKFIGGRGNRRGGHLGRGGFVGRGRWSPGKRGSLAGGARHYTDRPRAPQFVKRRSLEELNYISQGSDDSGDSYSQRWGRGRSTEQIDVSATNGVKYARTPRTLVAGDAVGPSNVQYNIDSFRQRSPLYNLQIGVSPSGRREISTGQEPQFDLRDLLRSKRVLAALGHDVESASSPVGRRVIASAASLDSVVNQKVMKENRAYPENFPSQDNRAYPKNFPSQENRAYPKNFPSQENRAYPKNLAPRFQRLQQQSSSVQERPVLSPIEAQTDLQQYFSDKNTVFSLPHSSNWLPPQDGHLYVEAFNNYFAQRGEVAPKIEIIPGKIGKVKGFYGRLSHQDKYYYPLEIMQNEEFACQNVIRAFCKENRISLLQNGKTEVSTNGKTEVSTTHSSSTSPAAHENEQVLSVQTNGDQSPKPEVNDSHEPSQEQPAAVGSITAVQQKPLDLPETLEKVYKILKPNGIWLSRLSQLYETTYGETLTLDIMSVASQWPQYFTLEQFAGNRCTIYPVARDIPETTEKTSAQVLVPAAVQPAASQPAALQPAASQPAASQPAASQPAVGSKLQMFFSFAYSAEDIYLQKADMENLVYEIDDVLNKNCPNSLPPAVETIALNSLVAASYENSWYRAQVLAVEKSAVKVCFIDYGNKEEVNVANLRPIPQDLPVLNTPSLAIRCAMRKTKAGEWLKDVLSILTDLSETNAAFSAEIVEHKGYQCIVDLYTMEGGLVNDMLLQSVSPPEEHRLEEVCSPTKSAEQGVAQIAMAPPVGHRLEEVCSPTKSAEQGVTQTTMTPPAGHRMKEVGSATKSAEQRALQTAKTSPFSATATRLFADDPDPLMLPDGDTFAVYVCRVMSENTVLLRIVDDAYSDKLDELEQEIADNFYSRPIPEKIQQSNIYACMVLAGSEDAEDVEYDEEGKEKLTDQNKYHRVRVLKEHKNGSCDCYLPDHGHNETLNRSQLRKIDPQLNRSLSYQAVMARLHGLDNLPDKLKPMAVRLLIKLLTTGATLFAVRKGKSAEKRADDTGGCDVTVTNRVRKIISCMNDISPGVVAQLYQDIYKESIENVEEVIKNIPGYGYWREILEVDLFDTSQEDDVNINEFVLATIEEMQTLESIGGNVENIWRDLFCSDTSQTDTEGGSMVEELDDWEGGEGLQDNSDLVNTGVGKTDPDTQHGHVKEPVQDLTEADNSVKPAPGKALYTWKTKPESEGGAAASCPTPTTIQAASSTASVCDACQLPKFWSYPLLKFVSLQIVRVENPSDFVAIPMEQRGALEKLEVAIAQYFSVNKEEAAASICDNVLYAVKFKDVYRRALYVSLIEDVVKVFFPDHHCYDMVPPSQLLPLPQQFYSLPFLARKMRLGGIQPHGQDWPAHVVQWFKTTVGNKTLYALVTGEDSTSSSSRCVPGTLAVRLIDTSGSEDLVVEEYMESHGMAVCEPSSD